jgi:hypothetical protein
MAQLLHVRENGEKKILIKKWLNMNEAAYKKIIRELTERWLQIYIHS